MSNEFSMRELYDVVLKATYPIEINGKVIQEDEIVAAFDKIQLANFQEIKSSVSANGGFDNRNLVTWQSTKEINLTFTQGIFSQVQLGLMTNSRLINVENETVQIHQREYVQSDEDGNIIVKYEPISSLYIYNSSGNKVTVPNPLTKYENEDGTWTLEIEGGILQNYTADYNFNYNNGTIMKIGNQLLTGCLSFEGRTKVQDDISGNFRTGIIKIPKLKLMSGLSIKLGTAATPVVGTIQAIGMPVGTRGQEEVARFIFLDDDIDSDI